MEDEEEILLPSWPQGPAGGDEEELMIKRHRGGNGIPPTPMSPSSSDNTTVLVRKALSMLETVFIKFMFQEDILALSASATWLRPYLRFVTRVKVRKPFSFKASLVEDRQVLLGLTNQLTCFRLMDPTLLTPLLQALRSAEVSPLHALILTGLGLDDWRMQQLGAVLKEGCCANLRELDISYNEWNSRGMTHLVSALMANAIPNLKRLKLAGMPSLNHRGLQSLSKAVSQGCCRGLQELDLDMTSVGSNGVMSLCYAMEDGGCPDLRRLYLSRCKAGGALGTLGDVLSRGACRHLEELVLSGNALTSTDQGLALISSIHACKSLKRLEMSDMRLGPIVINELARTLKSGAGKCLQYLDLQYNPLLGDLALTDLWEALQPPSCPQLIYLDVSKTNMKAAGAWSLSRMLRSRHAVGMVGLRVLKASHNPIGDEGLGSIVEALNEGCGGELKVLVLKGSGATEKGWKELAVCLDKGSCPVLQTLEVKFGHEGVRAEAWKELHEALATGRNGNTDAYFW